MSDIKLPEPFALFQLNAAWGSHEEVIPSCRGEAGVIEAYTADQVRAAVLADRAARAETVVAGEVNVTVSGFTGSGKSAIAGEIEILCRALGLDVNWVNGKEEKAITHADWTTALELYKPRIRIIEVNVPRTAPTQERGADDE